jgi:hypothetical protein
MEVREKMQEDRGMRYGEIKVSNATNYKPQSSSSSYIFPFEKLDVWQMAVDLADHVLGLLGKYLLISICV